MANSKIQLINQDLLQRVSKKAKEAPRRRINHNFHQLPDPVQRFLNGIEPDSYIRPHRHIDPLKDEIFLVLKGKGAVFIFEEDGTISETCLLDPEKDLWGVDIPGGLYHCIISLEEGSVFYEVKQGPYLPATAKHFASWAPEENTPESQKYLEKLKAAATSFLSNS